MPLHAPIRAICFDIDGTLSDSDDLAVQRLARLLRPLRLFGVQNPNRLARKVVMAAETPLNFLYTAADRHGIDDEIIHIANFLGKLMPSRPKVYRVVPGVEKALKALSSRYRLGVVSARPRAYTVQFLTQTGLLGYFGDCIATAETCERTKPSPEPLLWAAKCLGVAPEECVMVGDTTVDVLAGKAAGAQTVGVLCGFGEKEELQAAGADLILHSTADLPNFLPEEDG